MYKAFIFDIDGTMLDNEGAVLHSLQALLAEKGIEVEQDDLRFALGIPGDKALAKFPIEDRERALDEWIEKELAFMEEITVFPMIEETLRELPLCGVVSSKNQFEMEHGFYPFGLAKYFDGIVCASDTELHKPNPDPLLKCMELLQVSPEETVYIGDSIYDMQCAHAAGADFALASWGARDHTPFKETEIILKKPTDLLEYR